MIKDSGGKESNKSNGGQKTLRTRNVSCVTHDNDKEEGPEKKY
jgi:hypothetical protein